MPDQKQEATPQSVFSSRIDDEGQVLIPPALCDLTGLRVGMDVTLSEGRDGFVVILPAKLATAEDMASWPTEPPQTLSEGAEDRVEHLLGHIVPAGTAEEGNFNRLIFALGTWMDELTYTLGCEMRGQGESFDAEAYARRMKSCLTIIAMHDVWTHEEERPPLTGHGELIDSYAWYRTAKLSGWGGKTAADLVREGRGEAVVAYLDGRAAGGYA